MSSSKMELLNRRNLECDFELLKKYNKNMATIVTLNDLIAELRRVFDSDKVNIEYVGHLMKSYKSNREEWNKYAKFDTHRYTRNLVDTGNGKYNLILLCWGEGHGSAIHDHADSHCFMKMLEGTLQEVRFDWPEGDGEKELKEIGRNTLELNSVAYMNDSLGLHRVENLSHVEPAVSLHLYCPPYEKCQTFHQNTGQKNVCKVTFWSINGERIKENAKEIQPEDN